jgi:predicted metal-dependent phosphoesterase TrpH
MKYQSLHNHTNISDGKLTHFELLDVAQKYGFNVIAFTDHDSVPDEKIVKKLKQLNHPVKWIIGCEISSGLPKELGGGPYSDFHIIGLFVNPLENNLVNHCKLAQRARVERMERMVKNLKNLGIDITEEDCLRESKGEAIGRPHINAAIISKPGNLKILEELKLKMKKDAENNPTLKEKYEQMIEKGESQYTFSLFLAEDSYIKGVYVDYLYFVDFDKSVKFIRDADGIAFLAHWWLAKNKIKYDLVEKIVREKRIDGLEIISSVENFSSAAFMKKLADKYGILKGGGIDAHNEENFADFIKEKSIAERSIGLAEEIIKKAKPNLIWSSFSN